MRASRFVKIAAALATICTSWTLWAKSAPADITVISAHVHLGDVLPSAAASDATIDLGNAPPTGGSRTLTRAELAMAFTARGMTAPSNLPESVHVVRKAKAIAAKEIEQLIQAAVVKHPLKFGVAVATIRSPKNAQVVDGYDDAPVTIPRAPRKMGAVSTTATIEFFYRGESIDKLQVPIELKVDAYGAQPDVTHKSAITLVVKKGVVEISTPATADADADIGESLPVTVKASNKTLIAVLTEKEKALLEAP
jgi:hypothetical protein